MSSSTDTPADSVKAFINTVSPFITLAFGLIAFIYTRELSQTQAIFVEMKVKMEKRDDAAAAMAQTITALDGRMGRMETDGSRRESRINDLYIRINDLEKTFILSNVSRTK